MPPMYNRPEFVTMFLEKYRSLPSLWNKKYPGFSDRKQREKDYWDLFRMYKQNNQEATLRTMKSKMNSWFVVFRKEYVKAKESQESNEDLLYEPKIWYFKKLLFLAENDSIVMNGQPRMAKHNLDYASNSTSDQFEDVYMQSMESDMERNGRSSDIDSQWKEAKDHLKQVGEVYPNVIQLQTIKSRPCLNIDGYRYRFKRSNKEGQAIWVCMKDRSDRCLGKVVTKNGTITPTTAHVCNKDEDIKEKLKAKSDDEDWPPQPPPVKRKPEDEPPTIVFDEYEIIGKDVATKLRKMTEEQRCYAELLISHVISSGNKMNLTERTTLTNLKSKDEPSIDSFDF